MLTGSDSRSRDETFAIIRIGSEMQDGDTSEQLAYGEDAVAAPGLPLPQRKEIHGRNGQR